MERRGNFFVLSLQVRNFVRGDIQRDRRLTDSSEPEEGPFPLVMSCALCFVFICFCVHRWLEFFDECLLVGKSYVFPFVWSECSKVENREEYESTPSYSGKCFFCIGEVLLSTVLLFCHVVETMSGSSDLIFESFFDVCGLSDIHVFGVEVKEGVYEGVSYLFLVVNYRRVS